LPDYRLIAARFDHDLPTSVGLSSLGSFGSWRWAVWQRRRWLVLCYRHWVSGDWIWICQVRDWLGDGHRSRRYETIHAPLSHKVHRDSFHHWWLSVVGAGGSWCE